MFSENLDAFFNTTSGFAEVATVGGTPVDGIFDEPSADDVGIGSTKPTFVCATASLPAWYKTATIVIRSRNFKVAGAPDFDTTGNVVTLELDEQ